MRRKSGILLHPTSLPGRFGIGDLGDAAYRFVDFLADSGQTVWQVLPLGPPGYGNSPYQSFSSQAGNPLLISPEILAREGWLESPDSERSPRCAGESVDFETATAFKWPLLQEAARRFFAHASSEMRSEFELFCTRKAGWLESYSHFMALKDVNGGAAWTEWRRHDQPDPAALRLHRFCQFVFFRQWMALKRYCRDRSIEIIGDLPIFVAHDSSDVWGNREFFDLDLQGRPRTVAGVPPDYFSATGQLWGNPLYRWDVLEEQDYRWWIERVKATLELVDVVRLDHFRGFVQYFEIPGGSATAEHGRWVDGPGDRLFAALRKSLGKLPLIAEDLGYITPEVDQLRDHWELPGMRVLQFAFADESADDPHKPYNYVRNCVVYTGTHDNDTTSGWFQAGNTGDTARLGDGARTEREYALRYLRSDGREIHWDMIRAALASVADTAIIPLQDVLGLGSESRMNLPSTIGRNWRWRFRADQLTGEAGSRLRLLTETYGRCRVRGR